MVDSTNIMFLPENIDLAHSEKYNLSIRLAPNGFSFCIYSNDDPSVFHFQETGLGNKLSYIESIKKIVFDLGFFSNKFNKSSVVVVSQHYTIVPEQLFDSKHIKKLFDYNFHNQTGVVLSEKVLNGEYHVIFNMHEELHSFLTRHLFNPTIHHHSTSLIQNFIYFDRKLRHHCFLDFHEDYFTIICFSENELLTVNTFAETNSNNICYLMMGIWEKLGFDQNSDKLYISGKSKSLSEVETELKDLIKNIEYTELDPTVHLTKEQKDAIPTDLIALLCV